MRQQIIRFTIISLCIFSYGFGQSHLKISGRVVDAGTGEPVENAAVSLEPGGEGTYTGSDGHFGFENILAGKYDVSVSHVAYQDNIQTIFVARDSKTHLHISLKPRKYWSDPIIVEESSTDEHVIRIDEMQIAQSEAHSIDQLLQGVQGIQIQTQGNSGAKGIRIHGSNTNQVLVLLDGIPLNDPLTGEVDLEQIPVSRIEEVDISTRGSSAEYGEGAFAGVIDIQTGSNSLSNLRAEGAAGSYGYEQYNADVNGQISGWEYSVSLGRQLQERDYPYSYSMPDGTVKQERRKNAFIRSESIHTGLSKTFSGKSFQIDGYYLDNGRGQPGRIFQWTPYATAHTSRYGTSGKYQHSDKHSQFSLLSSYSNSTTLYKNNIPEDAPLKYKQVPEYSSTYSHHQLRTSGDYYRTLSDFLSLRSDVLFSSSGFQQTQTSGDFQEPISANQMRYGIGVGADGTVPLWKDQMRLKLRPSLRYSHIKMEHGNTQISYPYASYSVTATLQKSGVVSPSIFATVSRSFRAPTYGDLFYQDFRVSGNQDLRPEKNREIYLGGSISMDSPLQFTLRGELFRKVIDNQIIWLTGSFGNFTPANTDSRITGQSVSFRWELPDRSLYASIYFEHLLPLDKTPVHTVYNKILPFRPEYQWQGSAGTDISIFSLRYYHRYQGIRYSTRANTKRLQPFQVGDLTLSTAFDLPGKLSRFRLDIGLRIENLWDTDYEVMHRMPEPGRSAYLSAALQLNS